MDQVADHETAADVASSDESGSGVRPVVGAGVTKPPQDPPTEEIEIQSVEMTVLPPMAASAPPPPAIARRTSVPPPPPAEALRVRLSIPPRTTPPRALTAPAPAGSALRAPAVPVAAATPEAEALKAELERVAKRMRERDAYLRDLEAVFAQRSEALLKAEAELEVLRVHAAEQDERIAELERRAADQRPLSAPPPAAGDDLTRIRGIGPRFARALAELGADFAAIAAWTPDEVAEIGKKLKVAPLRIERDRWIEQARELAANR